MGFDPYLKTSHESTQDHSLIQRCDSGTHHLSAAEAEAAVAATLRQTAAQFWEWLAAGAAGKLELTGSFPGGSVMLRGATASTPGSGITLVLKGSGGGNWFILRGFPLP